ncbi:hypothetical protein N7451_007327 [Penicillium sp. IBT 35674x]|nr:hypothetical protein N7451_007327 [Penicillium sp. IBT 35674x]
MLESIQAPLRQSFEDHRSLSILAFYLTLCATLALNICLKIYRQYRIRKVRPSWSTTHGPIFTLFLILASVSLATTWYYMFAFFRHSYTSWAAGQAPAQQALIETKPYLAKLELWLRDRKLFREAWESVSETPAKFWWSGQIFLWTIGWSLFLGVMGRRYNISNVWVYMLLGQVVAISFAQNLFFATVLVSNPSTIRGAKTSWIPPAVLELAPVAISFLGAAVIPFVANTPYFMPVLAVPHLLLPYKLPLITISIGKDQYGIPWPYLEIYPRFRKLAYSGKLELAISPDIGHTIVHFLYTGKWQTIDCGLARGKTYTEREYQRCVQVYHASLKYDLSELKIMAEKYIAHFGNEFSAMELLRLTTEVISEFPEDEFWLPNYVTNALQEMAGGVNVRVNVRDNSSARSPGSLAIMAAVIEAQFSRILDLESTRGNYQVRPGVMHGFDANHYPHSRYDMPPMPARPISPSSAANSASTGVRRCPRSASSSSEKSSASVGSGSVAEGSLLTPDEDSTDESLVRAAEYPARDPADASATFPDCGTAEPSGDAAPSKVGISVAVTEDGSPSNESTDHPDDPVVEEHVKVLVYEESIVEVVEASIYEESSVENAVAEESSTEAHVQVTVYEESVLEESVAEEPVAEESVPWEPVAEESASNEPVEEPVPEKCVPEEPLADVIDTENNRPHSLLPNSDLYANWKSLPRRNGE